MVKFVDIGIKTFQTRMSTSYKSTKKAKFKAGVNLGNFKLAQDIVKKNKLNYRFIYDTKDPKTKYLSQFNAMFDKDVKV